MQETAELVSLRRKGKNEWKPELTKAVNSKRGGCGLPVMRGRVQFVRGILNMRPRLGGGGTQINIEIPMNYEVYNG